MFSVKYPLFEKGRMLKSEMLENMRDFPRTFSDVFFQSYSDGIITGADLLVSGEYLLINKGIVKHQDRLYVLDQEYQLPYGATNKEVSVKLRFHEEQMDPDFVTYHAEVLLDPQLDMARNELELGRFKLKSGARLRSDYESMEDFITEFNTLNLIHCRYAGKHGDTIHPTILRYFAKEVLKSERQIQPHDIQFAMQILQDDRVERDVILFYLALKLGTGYRSLTNAEIHRSFCKLLKELRSGRGGANVSPNPYRRNGGPHKVVID